jgi:hypothetical protein
MRSVARGIVWVCGGVGEEESKGECWRSRTLVCEPFCAPRQERQWAAAGRVGAGRTQAFSTSVPFTSTGGHCAGARPIRTVRVRCPIQLAPKPSADATPLQPPHHPP